MIRRIDFLGFFHGSMVQPKHHISCVTIILEIWTSYGHRLVSIMGEDRKRACSIKANASNSIGIDVVLAKSSLDALANATPDIGSRLLVISCLWLPQANILCSHCLMLEFGIPENRTPGHTSLDIAGGVNDTSSCGSCPNVYTDIVIRVRVQIMQGTNQAC
jgi:hypothetical protein